MRGRSLRPLSRIVALFRWVRWELKLRAAVQSVQALDESMLADIGLRRGGIESAIRHGRKLPCDRELGGDVTPPPGPRHGGMD